MRRPDGFSAPFLRHRPTGPESRHGYTLVEILTATVLMLIIMMAVTVIFASVTDSIGQSRATLEMTQRVRAVTALLKQDLEGITAPTTPPLHPKDNPGYFLIKEGPIGPVVDPLSVAWNAEAASEDSTVGDIDDILMFTTRTKGEPFVGIVKDASGTTQTITSDTAEIIWFVRGRTLYRRVLLVKPDVAFDNTAAGFYATSDLSVRKDWNTAGAPVLIANSLADLTKPECRFGFDPSPTVWTAPLPSNRATEGRPHPFFAKPWLGASYSGGTTTKWVPGLGMPILAECSAPNWKAGDALPTNATPAAATDPVPIAEFDAWADPHPWSNVEPLTGRLTVADGTRIGEDVVLTNVVGFDVKVWDPAAPILDGGPAGPLLPGDPGYQDAATTFLAGINSGSIAVAPPLGAYVDLNFLTALPRTNPLAYPDTTATVGSLVLPAPHFGREGAFMSRVYGRQPGGAFFPAVYDTWSLHYEHNQRLVAGVPVGDEDRDGLFDEGSNGFDDDGANGVDDVGERETQPPYDVPLKGIQIKIRAIEPGSRQVREVTIVQKLRTK